MIKIVIVHPMDPLGNKVGGIQTFIRGFIKYAPIDFEINLIGITSNKEKRPVGQWQRIHLGDRGINFLPVFFVEDENKRKFIPLTLKFVFYLIVFKKRIHLDNVVYEFHRVECVIPFIFNKNKKAVFIHGHPRDLRNPYSEIKWKKIPRLYFLLEKLILKKVDKIYFVREDGAEYYKKKNRAIKGKISFIPTWADNEVFHILSQKKQEQVDELYRKKYNIKPEDRIIIYVGRFEGQKDPLLLLETFKCLISEYNNVKLLLVGSGGLQENMEILIKNYGIEDNVVFCGLLPHKEIAKVFNISDVFLLTSAFEGMPRSVVESVACGLPVVTTDVGEAKRVVKDGISGRVVSERNPQLLSQAVKDVLNDTQYRDRISVKNCVLDYFALNILEKVYNRHRVMSEN